MSPPATVAATRRRAGSLGGAVGGQQVRGGQDVVNALGARPPASWTAVTRVAQSRKLIVAGISASPRYAATSGSALGEARTRAMFRPRVVRYRLLRRVRPAPGASNCWDTNRRIRVRVWSLVCPFSLTSCPLNHRGEFFRAERRDKAVDCQHDRFDRCGRCGGWSGARPVRQVIGWGACHVVAFRPAASARTALRFNAQIEPTRRAPRRSASCAASRCTCRLLMASSRAAAATLIRSPS